MYLTKPSHCYGTAHFPNYTEKIEWKNTTWQNKLLNKGSYSFTNDDNLRCHLKTNLFLMGFPGGSDGKESACNEGDLSLIPGSGGSPWEGNGYPLHYSCLENSMDRGTWRVIIHGVAKSWISLSDYHKKSLQRRPIAVIKLFFHMYLIFPQQW